MGFHIKSRNADPFHNCSKSLIWLKNSPEYPFPPQSLGQGYFWVHSTSHINPNPHQIHKCLSIKCSSSCCIIKWFTPETLTSSVRVSHIQKPNVSEKAFSVSLYRNRIVCDWHFFKQIKAARSIIYDYNTRIKQYYSRVDTLIKGQIFINGGSIICIYIINKNAMFPLYTWNFTWGY